MAEKQSNKERLKDITDSIEQGIKEMFNSDKYKQYLSTMSRFHKYSVNNQVLIYMQRPDATLVAGFHKWRDNFGRNVMKGEKGIKIIAPTPFKKKIEEQKLDPDTKLPMLDADGKVITEEKEIKIPMYKPVVVFDVSQTDGKPLPELASTLTGEVQNYDVFMEALKRSAPVPLAFEAMAADMDGYFSRDEQRIAIREGMSEVQTVCAAIHEIAHSKLHNTENIAEEKLSRATEEIQAESISFAVCAYYGIETGENSFGYLASWAADKDLKELRESLETINKASSSLIKDIDRNYAEIMKEREISATEQTAEQDVFGLSEKEALAKDIDELFLDYYTSAHMRDYPDRDQSVKEIIKSLESSDSKAYIEVVQEIADDDESEYAGKAQDMVNRLESYYAVKMNTTPTHEQPEQERSVPLVANTELDSLPVPDPAISVESMNAYGYTDANMLPLTKERALELIERDVTVYMLHTDNTEAMAFDSSDVMSHDGIFGIERSEWETVKDDFKAPTKDSPVSDNMAVKPDHVVSYIRTEDAGARKQSEQRQAENYLKTAEMSTEDDYGMIDGVLNNGKKPTTAELDADVEAGKPISLFEYTQAIKREKAEEKAPKQPEKKPSVLAKLHPTVNTPTKTAPTKGAERER